MPQFGATPLSTTVLGANQFPVSAARVPNFDLAGSLIAVEGMAVNTDTYGYQTTAIRLGLKDGDDATQGLTTDSAVTGDVSGTLSAKLRGLSKIFAQLQFDGSSFLKVNVAAGTIAAAQSGTWNINNISGTISLPTGAAQDATVAKLNISPATILGANTGPMVQGSVAASAPTYTTGNINPLSLTTSGALRVDASATTQPVSGTFWQATQPISATSLPLPTGAATAAKQPALGTAGNASSDVITVQGIASMTALKVDGSAVTQPVSGTFWQATQPVSGTVTANAGSGSFTVAQATGSNLHAVLDSGSTTAVTQATASNLNAQIVGSVASAGANAGNPVKIGGAYNSTQPTVTTGQIVDIQTTARGAQIVATGVDAFAVNASQSGTWNINNVSGTVSLPTGASTSAKQPALGTAGSASSDVLTVQGIASMTALKVDGSAVTQPVSGTFWQATQPVSGTVTANIGTSGSLALDTSVNGILVSQGSTTSGEKGPLVQGAVTTSAPSYTTAQTSPLSLDTSGLLRVSLKDTPANTNNLNVNLAASSATVTVSASGNFNNASISSTGSAVPASASYLGANKSGNLTGLSLDGSGNLNVNVAAGSSGNAAAAATGSAVPASADYTGINVAGTLRGQTGVNPSGSIYAGQMDLASVAGTTTDTNSGTKSTGTLRVVLATDQPQLTNALKVDGSAVTQPVSATNLQTNLNQIAGSTIATAATGVQKVGIVGNTGATMDSTIGAGTAPTNAIVTGSVYNASAPAPTSGQSMALQADQAGNIRTFPGMALTTLAAWNSSTSLNATQTIFTNSGGPAVVVQLDQTTTLTAGAITFEVTFDGTNWVTAPAGSVLDPTSPTFAQISLPYTVQASTNKAFILTSSGWQGLRIKLSTQITGTGTVTPYYALLAYDPVDSVVAFSPTAANFNVSAVQSGTWTVQPGNTANTTPWLATINQGGNSAAVTASNALKVDGSAVTQPVSGTITANIGTSGSLALDTSVNGILVSQGSTTSGEKGPLIQGAVTTNAPSYTTAQTSPLSLDTSGLLRASLKDTPSNTNNLNVNLAASAATVTVSGTVTANAGTNLNTSSLALESGGNLATIAGAVIAQGTALGTIKNLMVAGSVTTNAPSYSTGNINPLSLDTSGLLRASLKDTPSNTNNLNVNLAASAATVTVTATNLQTNLNQVAGSTVATAATGIQKVGIVGNTGATVDSTVGAGSAPTNAVTVGAIYNASAPAPTTGQAMAVQLDQAGNVRAFPGIALAALSAWSSGTSLNATQNIFTNSGAVAVLVQLTQTTTLTAGAITFEVSYDGSNWSTIPASCVLDPTSTTFAQISLPYTVQASTNKAFLLNMNGAQGLRIKLSTQITGTGTVTPNYALLPDSPADTVIALSPTAANFNATATIQAVTGTSLGADQSNSILKTSLYVKKSANADTVLALGSATSANSVPVVVASDQGAFPVSQSGTWTVQPGNTANTTAWLVQDVAATSGGSTPSHTMSAASTNATSLKGSAGMVYGLSISNANASARYFKLYNKASSPTVGTDTPILTLQIPGNGTVIRAYPVGLALGTGIAWAATGVITDADTTAIGANDLSIDIDYK